MRYQPGDSPTEGIDCSDRPIEVLEREIDRTEQVIRSFREEYAVLLRDVRCDVEKLREAAAALPAESARYGHRRHDRVEHRIEDRLEALIASLPGRVTELVTAELAGPNVSAALNKLVDAKLRAVTEAIARIRGEPQPGHEFRRRRSRRHR